MTTPARQSRLVLDPGGDVPHAPRRGQAPDFEAWVQDRWSARAAAFVAAFEVERTRVRRRYQDARAALRAGEAERDSHLMMAEGYGASAATLRRMREEHERDLAEHRFALWEARRHGEWLAECRLVIWLGAMARAVITEREAR